MRRIPRLLLKRLHDHPLHVLVADHPRLPRPRLVVQPVQPTLREPHPPLAHSRGIAAQLLRDLDTRAALASPFPDPATARTHVVAEPEAS